MIEKNSIDGSQSSYLCLKHDFFPREKVFIDVTRTEQLGLRSLSLRELYANVRIYVGVTKEQGASIIHYFGAVLNIVEEITHTRQSPSILLVVMIFSILAYSSPTGCLESIEKQSSNNHSS